MGMGNIGFEVAKRAVAFGMKILYSSRSPKPDAEENMGRNMFLLTNCFHALITLVYILH